MTFITMRQGPQINMGSVREAPQAQNQGSDVSSHDLVKDIITLQLIESSKGDYQRLLDAMTVNQQTAQIHSKALDPNNQEQPHL